MNFTEAMELLAGGTKVTREPWKKDVYFVMEEGHVKSYQPKVMHYSYNEEIMTSEGWYVDEDLNTEYKFCEIVPRLIKGSKAKLKDWHKDTFIFLDRTANLLAVHSMDVFQFIPDFGSFAAQDWVELP